MYFHAEIFLKTILVAISFLNSKLLHSGGKLITLLELTTLLFYKHFSIYVYGTVSKYNTVNELLKSEKITQLPLLQQNTKDLFSLVRKIEGF